MQVPECFAVVKPQIPSHARAHIQTNATSKYSLVQFVENNVGCRHLHGCGVGFMVSCGSNTLDCKLVVLRCLGIGYFAGSVLRLLTSNSLNV